jgi:hypothetical protein
MKSVAIYYEKKQKAMTNFWLALIKGTGNIPERHDKPLVGNFLPFLYQES